MPYESYCLSLRDRTRWSDLVSGTPQDDIHFIPEYLVHFERHMDCQCRMFVFGDDESYVLYPHYIRRIATSRNRNVRHGDIFDAISPWYYGGPLARNPNPALIQGANEELARYFKDSRVVSFFSRSNPYRANHDLLGEMMTPYNHTSVVYIDLTKDLDDIWERSFNNNTRRNIRKDLRTGPDIFLDKSDRYIREFHRMYTKEMQSKGASSFYFFSYEFLKDLLTDMGDNALLTNKVYGDEWVAGSMEIYHNGIAYGFLGTRDHEQKDRCSQYLLEWKTIASLKERGQRIYDLGGGPPGSGLLAYKQSFSTDTLPMVSRRMVLDRSLYRDLSGDMNGDHLKYEEADYFPEYRINDD